MAKYKKGDVVLVPFAYLDKSGNYIAKVRPGVIFEAGDVIKYAIVQVTTKNRTDGSIGIWVKRDSARGKQMGLLADSFINLGVINQFEENTIIKLIGNCDDDCMDQLEMMLEV
ncbi:type II toxin-antitoxin system PemK/MazF family toxin [Roseivirga seohaensis]|uniref:type II toxin-antitoxin system PemK/MazF family toxin n=1 Tax=Roseivirga seohaensis TaxID=1914963 RepID=UPI003BA93D10